MAATRPELFPEDSREAARLIISWAVEFRDTVDLPAYSDFDYLGAIEAFFDWKLSKL
jgi:hypothetical protein